MESNLFLLLIVFFQSLTYFLVNGEGCIRRFYGHASYVCVCNSTYCDTIPALKDINVSPGSFGMVLTTLYDENNFDLFYGTFDDVATGDTTITVNYSMQALKQEVAGFGTTFTDGSGLVHNSLPSGAQDNLMRSIFGDAGLNLNLARVPIGGTDSSSRSYSLDDVAGDTNLVFFNLTQEDFDLKIPLIKEAMSLSSGPIDLFGVSWSPPSWMKTNQTLLTNETLEVEYWETYSQYLLKFLEAYESEGLSIKAISPQRTPILQQTQGENCISCHWEPEEMRDWIKTSFGPNLTASPYNDTILFTHDDTIEELENFQYLLLDDLLTRSYIGGTGLNWYRDHPPMLTEHFEYLYENYPDKSIFYVETTTGFASAEENTIRLGGAGRAHDFGYHIAETLNYFVNGWILKQYVVDEFGGPSYCGFTVDSPFVANLTSGEFYKQPTAFAMGHASAYIEKQARIRPIELYSPLGPEAMDIVATAARNPDGKEILYIYNYGDENNATMSINTNTGQFINLELLPGSVYTIIHN